MGRRPWWTQGAGRAGAGVLVAITFAAGVATAKPWAEWAPAPLASDSSYAALAARPSDSLSTSEYAWVDLQRDWRAQRLGEQRGSGGGITSIGVAHVERKGDSRFANLASRPFATLGQDDLVWLITENAAQRGVRSGGIGSAAVGGVLLGAVVGGVLAIGLLAYAIGHATWFP